MKIFTLVLALMCCFSFAACETETQSEKLNEGRFLFVNANNGATICVDKETRVMYFYYSSGLSVMLDENGNPLLWEGDLQNG